MPKKTKQRPSRFWKVPIGCNLSADCYVRARSKARAIAIVEGSKTGTFLRSEGQCEDWEVCHDEYEDGTSDVQEIGAAEYEQARFECQPFYFKNAREHAHVLAALRYTQRMQDRSLIFDSPDHFQETGGPLDGNEIDALCERINLGEQP